MINTAPATLRYLKNKGCCAIVAESPKQTNISNKVNPIVAPETNGKVFLNPWAAPDDIMIILTGPGDNDRVREKMNIVKIKIIFSP
jgi:hypothetical protein